MKTVRFAKVVEQCGHPRAHSLWLAPDRDPEFQAAVKAGRVMTVGSTERGKADVGTVGFDEKHAQGAQFLIFPKPLKRFAGARVVGVKFELVEQPKTIPAKPADHVATDKKTRHRKVPGHRPAAQRAALVSVPSEPEDASGWRSTPSPPTDTGEDDIVEEKPMSRAHAAHVARPPAKKGRSRERRSEHVPPSTSLLEEVRLALDELREGKTVAAYQRLERAAAAAAHTQRRRVAGR